MRLGIVNQETWGFFNEIYAELKARYQTSVFTPRTVRSPVFRERINQNLYYRDLQAFMRGNDVVFFEWASELLAQATRFPKRCGIVTRLHRYEMYRWVNHVDWDKVDKVIVVSHAKAREFAARFPAHAGKLVVSSPSTSLEKFTPSTKPFAGDLGTLCHLSPRKRVYDLILTFYELCQQRDGFHLHIAGGADQYNEDYNEALHHIVGELQLQDKVTFYGNVKEAWDWYHKIDIFISNSFSEGLQVAPMEAMASGCYCLIHRWSGAEEMVPAENLFFTGTELRTSILEYAELPAAQQQALQVRMRELACEKFDINQTKQQIANVIDEVAAAVGNAPGHR